MEYESPSLWGPQPADEFGVPGSFGVIDPQFCGALARVVMLAALLEDRLWRLLTQLKTPPIDKMIFDGDDKNVVYQSTYAGKTAQPLINQIRGALKALAPEFEHHVPTGKALMDDAERIFEERNNFVHNVWSKPTLDNGYGHRGISESNRIKMNKADHEFQHDFVVTRETFTTVIAQLVAIYDRIRDFEERVKAPLYPRVQPPASVAE